MRIDQAVVVGCGGTGSHLLEPLARLLSYHPDGIHRRGLAPGLVVVDGDRFEPRNGERQLGTVENEHKAHTALGRVAPIVETAVAVPRYVDRLSFRELVLDGLERRRDANLLVVLSVDNHATRRDLLQALVAADQPNLLCLNPGNDLAHGQVHCWARIDGRDVTPCPLALDPDGQPFHPELLHPPDRIPGGCQQQAPSTPQLITANAWAAAACLALVQAWLDDQPLADEVCFDARQLKLVRSGPLVPVAKALAKQPPPAPPNHPPIGAGMEALIGDVLPF